MILTIAGGLALGIIVAIVNTLISKKAMASEKNSTAIGVNALRFVLDIVALAVAFFVCRAAQLNIIAGLVSTAVGLTVCGTILLVMVTKKITKEAAEKNRAIAEKAAEKTEEE